MQYLSNVFYVGIVYVPMKVCMPTIFFLLIFSYKRYFFYKKHLFHKLKHVDNYLKFAYYSK